MVIIRILGLGGIFLQGTKANLLAPACIKQILSRLRTTTHVILGVRNARAMSLIMAARSLSIMFLTARGAVEAAAGIREGSVGALGL